MIRNVVFDLGGVVIGRDYERFAHKMKAFAFLQGDRPFPQFWKDYDKGLLIQIEVAKAIANQESCILEEALEGINTIKEMFNEFPRTVELVRELSEDGYKIYVLSNMPKEFWDHIQGYEVAEYFDGALISSQEKMSKPDKRFFGLLKERFGLVPQETLFVDDKPSNTSVAEELGFHTVLFDANGDGPDMVRNYIKNSL